MSYAILPRGDNMSIPSTFLSKIALLLCLSLPSAALAAGSDDSDNSATNSSSSYSTKASASYLMKQAQRQLGDENYQRALELLQKEVILNPDNADGWNLLGFSARKLGDYNKAKNAYTTALQLDPKHTRAMEYMGEMYLRLNQLDEAEKLLTKLNDLCQFNCKDRDMLKAAIASYKQGSN